MVGSNNGGPVQAGGATRRGDAPARRRLAAVLVAVVAAVVAVPGGASAAAPAKLTFRPVRTIAHTLRGNFRGAGPDWEDFSTPAIADITGDRVPEIVFATVDGYVFAVRATDGKTVWKRDLGRTAIQASPAIRQLLGSSAADVVVATMDGRVVVLDGPTGRTVRTLGQGPPLHCPPGVDCRPDGFFGTPALADVDGDGKADIVASSFDHTVYAWKATGQLIFRQFLEDTIWSSPVVADIDRDGRPEVVVGGDIAASNNLGVAFGGLVWAITRAGGLWHVYPGYPKSIPGQTVWSTPAVADVNGDGRLDVVVGTGNNAAHPTGPETQRVHAFTATTRADLPGWPVSVTGHVSNGPAITDVDHDGKAEVAFGSEGARVYVRNRTGSSKWSACAATGRGCGAQAGGSHGAVTVADLDGDGTQEVVAALDLDLVAFDGRTGKVKARIPFGGGDTVQPSGSPTIATVGGKAYLAVQASSHRTGPPAAGDTVRVFVFTTDRAPGTLAWPTFKRSSTRSG